MHDQDSPRAVSLDTMTIQLGLLDRLPPAFLRRHRVLPHELLGSTLRLVLPNPDDRELVEELAFITGLTVAAETLTGGDLDKVLEAAIEAWQKGEQTLTPSHGPSVGSEDLVYLEDLGGLGGGGAGFAPKAGQGSGGDFSFGGGLVDVGDSAGLVDVSAAAGFAGLVGAAPPSIPEPSSGRSDSADFPAVVDLAPIQRSGPQGRNTASEDALSTARLKPISGLETTELADDVELLDDVDLMVDVDLVDDDGIDTTPALGELEVEPDVPERRPAAGLSALIAHGERDHRERIATALSRLGFSTLQAGDTLDVLQHLEHDAPALILLDAELRGTHPFALARQLRQEPRFAGVAIVVMTSQTAGWALNVDLQTTYGVDAILGRTADVQTTIWTAERALARQRSEPPELRDPEVRAEAEELVRQGTALFRREAVDEAIALFRKGIALDPFQPALFVSLAVALVKQRQPYEAMRLFERAIELDPTLVTPMKNLAVLYEKKGFRHKAVELWLRTLHATDEEKVRVEIRSRIARLL
ncbi:MAG: hypothetical protein ABI333_04065 [bacterium]